MTDFMITAPDGKKYKVSGPDQAGAIAALKKMLGVSPADTPADEKRARLLAAKSGTLQASPQSLNAAAESDVIAQDRMTLSGQPAALNALAKFNQGIPFVGEYADELTGLISEPAMQQQRAVLDAMDRQNPKTSMALQAAGGIVGSIPLAAVAAPSIFASAPATVVGKAAVSGLAAGAAGAVEGGIAGFGRGNDGDRIRSAGTGAVIGGALGTVIGAAAPAVAKGIKAIAETMKGRDVRTISRVLGISDKAARVVKANLEADDFVAAEKALKRAGSDAMLADAGPATAQMLDSAAQSGGAATRIARSAVDNRANSANRQLTRTMDMVLGKPVGIDGLKSAIKDSTAKSRKSLYDRAFSVEIDWKSPAGRELRALLNTTPDDVLHRAAKNSGMSRRVDDAAAMYADEFAPTISSKPGEMSGDYAGRQDVKAFFDTYKEASATRMKRPLTNVIKNMGGIDPNTKLASDLRAMGITSKTTPGIFRVGGLKDVDNLDASNLPDILRNKIDDGSQYVNRQAIIDALRAEVTGEAVEDVSATVGRDQAAELDRLLPEYEAKRNAVIESDRAMSRGPTAQPDRGDIVPMKSIKDIDAIKRALDEIDRTNDGLGLMGGKTEYGMEAGRRAREIRDLLAEISPVYKQALSEASDTISRVKGVEFGAELLTRRASRESVAEFMAGATEGERVAAMQGMRQYIDETLANVQRTITDPNIDAREAMKVVKDMSSRASREKMDAVLGAARAKPLFDALDEAAAHLELRSATARNSATASRLAGKAEMDAAADPGALGALLEGEPVNAGRKLVKALTGRTDDAKIAEKQKLYAEIAQALTQKRGPEAERALRVVQDAISGQPFRTDDAIRIARVLTAGGALTSYQSGQKYLASRSGAR